MDNDRTVFDELFKHIYAVVSNINPNKQEQKKGNSRENGVGF